jgi:hypothetical protein
MKERKYLIQDWDLQIYTGGDVPDGKLRMRCTSSQDSLVYDFSKSKAREFGLLFLTWSHNPDA